MATPRLLFGSPGPHEVLVKSSGFSDESRTSAIPNRANVGSKRYERLRHRPDRRTLDDKPSFDLR